MSRILIVDDEDTIRLALVQAFSARHQVEEAADGESAMVKLRQGAFDLVLTDLRMGTATGLDVLREAKAAHPRCGVVILTAYGSVEGAVEAMKAGADDFLTKPFRLEEVERRAAALIEKQRLFEERDYLREAGAAGAGLVGESAAFKEVLRNIALAAPSAASVLILGETGSGKEGVARAVHDGGPRRKGPFVAVNCSAFATGLLESELFGHEKGAFTGAERLRKGRLELADGGTLFLDEVGDIPMETQVKLLRALETKSFERVGGAATLKSDFRLLAATHRDLPGMVKSGQFREDLYFRLAVFPISVPPLRERPSDLLLLAEHFLKAKAPGRGMQLPEGAQALLAAYPWPGNVRELQNVVERAVLLSDSQVLRLDLALAQSPAGASEGGVGNLVEKMEQAERELVAEALRRAEGNQTHAAKMLGIERSTLQYKLKKHKLV